MFFFLICSAHYQCHYEDADILFLFDASGSERRAEFEKVVQQAMNLSLQLLNASPSFRFGSATYSSVPRVDFPLGHYNEQQIRDNFHNVTYFGGASYTGEALRFVSDNVFKPDSSASLNKVLVVYTDGRSSHPAVTATQASLLQQLVTIIAVGVGQSQSQSELATLSSFNASAPADNGVLFKMITNLVQSGTCT